MKTDGIKLLEYTAMAICGGFAVLGFFNGDSDWSFWLVCFSLVLLAYCWQYKRKPVKKPDEVVESVLPEEIQTSICGGVIVPLQSDLKCRKGENCFWFDQMRTNYYGSEPHLFYLTNQRLVCLDQDFLFSFPLSDVSIERKDDVLTIQAGTKKMKFICASPEAFWTVWKELKGSHEKSDTI